MSTELDFESLQRLNADLRRAAETLSPSEIRYLVDAYDPPPRKPTLSRVG